jgi:large subunit ribosomal protein L28
MARICAICGKRPQVANTVSNANNRTKRWVYPNVQKIHYKTSLTGAAVHHDKVCTKCVKAGKVQKVI